MRLLFLLALVFCTVNLFSQIKDPLLVDSIHRNKQYSLCGVNQTKHNQKLSACYTFEGLKKIKVDTLEAGDIIAIAGIQNIQIGDTVSDNENPVPLPRIIIDEPTVSMFFHVNNSPFAGIEGKFLTSRNISERLY